MACGSQFPRPSSTRRPAPPVIRACHGRDVTQPPREIGGGRVVRFAGDHTWPAAEDPAIGRHSTVLAMALIDYGGPEYYILQVDDQGRQADAYFGHDLKEASETFSDWIDEVRLAEIPLD